MIVLSVDVGIRTCGYVVCDVRHLDIKVLKEDEISPSPKDALSEKLNLIFTGIESCVLEYKPQALIVERLYSHYRHPTTLGVLSQVRGVVLLLACQRKIKVFEYSPRQARKSFLGCGSADSERVKKMAENITGRAFKSQHTADAFSLVVAFSHAQKLEKIINQVK